MKEKLALHRVFSLFAFILIIWGFYRFLFRFPETIEELVLKPLIWLGATFWVVKKLEKKPLASLGFSGKNLFKSLYWGIFLGAVFAVEGLFTNYLKYGNFSFIRLDYTQATFLGAVGLSLVTAVSEETVFRGYIFNRLNQILKNEWSANVLSTFSFALIHLPITIFVLHYSLDEMAAYLLLVSFFGFGSAFVFARTGNIASSILMHVFWAWPIVLFR
jgi:membrane protease YdiL (CAAX protease family)